MEYTVVDLDTLSTFVFAILNLDALRRLLENSEPAWAPPVVQSSRYIYKSNQFSGTVQHVQVMGDIRMVCHKQQLNGLNG